MADEPEKSDEVEELMKLLGVDPGKAETPVPESAPPAEATPAGELPTAGGEAPPEVAPPVAAEGTAVFEPITPSQGQGETSIDMLRDVNLQVKVVLGRTRMFVSEVLKFSRGSVVELDKLTGDPLDVIVNDRLVARGEVLVINENFAIRITEVINPTRAKEEKL